MTHGARCMADDAPVDMAASIPATEEIFYRRALDYLERFRKEDLGQAVRLFNQVIKANPENPRGHGGLAEARSIRYLFGWEPDAEVLRKGLASGRRAVELDPDSAEARMGLGLALVASEQYTPALAEMDRAVSLAPESSRAHLYRGIVLRGLRRTEEALAEANRAIVLAPDFPVASAFLGDCDQDLRRFKEATASYLMAAQLDQELLWARLGLAAAYQRQTNFGAAEKTYLLTEKDFPDDSTRIRILSASLLVAVQRYDDAVVIYQAMSEKEAVSPPLYRRLMLAGRAYSLEKLERREESEYFWSKLVEEFPADFDGGFRDREVASQAFESLSRIYDSKGEPKRALAVLEKGCRNRGMNFGLYATLADRQRSSNKLEDAVETLRRGLMETSPDEDWVMATQLTLPTLKSAAASKASSRSRAAGLGLLQELTKRVTQANPPAFVPYLNLARAESLFRQNSQALEHLRLAVDKGYGGIHAAAVDPDFKPLADDPAFRALTRVPTP